MTHIFASVKESLRSVLPIALIVLILSVTCVTLEAGATGGTVIKGRLDDALQYAEFVNTQVSEEREMLCILAPSKASKQIMEDVNREFGLRTKAHSIICAVPVEKAYKI